MKKPFSIKLINFVLIIKLVSILLLSGLTILMFTINFNDAESILYHFQKGFIEAAGFTRDDLDNVNLISWYFGSLTFDFVSSVLLIIMTIIFLKKKKYIASIVALSLHTLLTIDNLFTLVLNIILLILLISNKKYFMDDKNKSVDESGM